MNGPGVLGGPVTSELLAFVAIGFRHITDLAAMDHVLFLLALAAVYRGRDWRDALWVISAFTVGHSVTLALAVTNALPVRAEVVEFLIPLTIVATAVANVVEGARPAGRRRHRAFRAILAGVFGLVHGAGFAGYLRSLFVDPIAIPLLGFNVGIELGQAVVLLIVGLALAAVDWALGRARVLAGPSPVRVRVLTLSVLVGIVAAEWAVERRPW